MEQFLFLELEERLLEVVPKRNTRSTPGPPGSRSSVIPNPPLRPPAGPKDPAEIQRQLFPVQRRQGGIV